MHQSGSEFGDQSLGCRGSLLSRLGGLGIRRPNWSRAASHGPFKPLPPVLGSRQRCSKDGQPSHTPECHGHYVSARRLSRTQTLKVARMSFLAPNLSAIPLPPEADRVRACVVGNTDSRCREVQCFGLYTPRFAACSARIWLGRSPQRRANELCTRVSQFEVFCHPSPWMRTLASCLRNVPAAPKPTRVLENSWPPDLLTQSAA